MSHASKNYLSYTLASFIIFFDVLVIARTIFTEDLSAFLLVLYMGLMLGLFVTWRTKNFAERSAIYGSAAAAITILLSLLNTQSGSFWLTLTFNALILIGFALLSTVFSPLKPLPVPLAFGKEPPRIEQDFAKKFRQKLKINADDHTVLLYGKPERKKQFDLAIKALPTIRELFPQSNVRLLITTWGDESRETKHLKQLIKRLDLKKNVRLIKTTEPEYLKYIINLADVIVFPYHPAFKDPSDLNAVLPYLKALVVPDSALFAQLVNNKTCLKVKDIKNKNVLAVTIERLLKNDQLLLQLGFNLSKAK